MRVLFATALFAGALALPACNRSPGEPQATVRDAVVTLPAVPGRPGAAYFTIETNNDPTRLTGVSSARAGRIELHETRGGSMAPIEPGALTFAPDAPLVFAPGGRHAMLFDLNPSLRPGDRIALTFRFEPVPPVTVEAEVRAPGDVHSGH